MEFDRATLPWVDSDRFEPELARRLEAGSLGADDAERLRQFREQGYVTFPGLLDADEVDGLVTEHDRAWAEGWRIEALVEGRGVVPVQDLPARTGLGHHHYRLNDLHDVSEPVRAVMLHPAIVRFISLYLDETPVAMQSLFFEYGSEQATHQDFAFVSAEILSHLVGCWVACDRVDDRNGPLFYIPGSHRLPKFDWGGGSLRYDGSNGAQTEAFARHIEDAARAAGLARAIFHAEPGDVFLWHGALAHGGSAATDPEATRRSLVVHYSSRRAYPRERRCPELAPVLDERNGGVIYRIPERGLGALYLRGRKGLKKLLRR